MIHPRILKRLRHLRGYETGGTIAELAILLPFLLLMMGAVTELGRYFQTYSTLAKSTRASSRYLSKVAYDPPDGPNVTAAKNIAFCGKTDCTGIDPVVSNLDKDTNILITSDPPAGVGNPDTITVSITNYNFRPLFDIGALLHNSFTMALPVKPSTTMRYLLTEPAGGEE